MLKLWLLVLLLILTIVGFSFSLSASATQPSDFGLKEGDLISAIFSDDPDVYIVNEHGFKRLFLNPEIFKFYTHLGGFFNVKLVTEEVVNTFPTSGLFRDCESNDQKVYGVDIEGEDIGQLHWVNTTGEQAVKDDPDFFKKVFCINKKEFNWYPKGNSLQTVKDVPQYERINDRGSATEEKLKEDIGFKEEGKVLVCHYTVETASKSEEILIDTSAVKAHLVHGDKLGACRGTTFIPVPTVVQTPAISPAPVCSKDSEKIIDFEDDSNVGANITDNLTHSAWLESKGISLTASPSGTIWTTKMSSTFQTGVVIGVASPDFTEQHQGLSGNESLVLDFLGSKAKTVTLTFTIKPTIGADNIPNSVTIQAYDSFGNVITSFDKTFFVIERGKYSPVDIIVSAGDFQISKLIIKSIQYASGGLFLEGIKFSVPCPISTLTPTPTPILSPIPSTTTPTSTPTPSMSSGPTPPASATPTPVSTSSPQATPILTTSPSPVVSASYSPTPTPTPTPATTPLATNHIPCGDKVKNVPADYSTIQAAINAASLGDTVKIAAGTYNEGLTINNKGGICIDGAGIDQTIITKSGDVGINVSGSSYITIRNITVKGSNSYIGSKTNGMGGGIHTYGSNNILIRYCRLTQNSADSGGGIYANHTTELLVDRCLIDNNHATNFGGIYYEPASTGTITNVTVANNIADTHVGGFGYAIERGISNRNLNILASIFYGNVGPITTYDSGSTNFAIYWTTTSPPAAVSISDIGGWFGGTGNISLDPKFVSSTDFHLQANSPATNMGVYPSPVSALTPTPTTSSNFSRNFAINMKINRDLYFGSTGNDVKQLQALLVNEVGYSADLITGYFGRITRDAVQRLQEKYAIKPAYGYFGEITRNALRVLILD